MAWPNSRGSPQMPNDRIKRTLEALWAKAGADPAALDDVTVTGADPVLPSIFRVGEASASTIAAVAAAAAELWRLKTGEQQDVKVDVRAAATAFRSERYLTVNEGFPPSPWGPLSGYFRTADDRFVQLHANFPHHHSGLWISSVVPTIEKP